MAGAPLFGYDRLLVERFPGIVGGVIHARGVRNGPSDEELLEAFAREQEATLSRIGDMPLSEMPSLVEWRRMFRGFGVDPTTYRSAAEALLRRLTKQGSIPTINCLVELGNFVSIRYALPVAVFDRRALTGAIMVRFAIGTEEFTDLGTGQTQQPEPGEVIFVDEGGVVVARRWCWRQSAESASGPDTREILVTVEGHHDEAGGDVASALADLEELLRIYASPESADGSSVSKRVGYIAPFTHAQAPSRLPPSQGEVVARGTRGRPPSRARCGRDRRALRRR